MSNVNISEPLIIHAYYLRDLINSLVPLCEKIEEILSNVEFDTFIGTGISGALILPLLATKMNKKFAIVRKEGDNSHSAYEVEGIIGSNWIFVDDLISSGTTIKRVYAKVNCIANRYNRNTRFIGVFLYYNLFSPEYCAYDLQPGFHSVELLSNMISFEE